MTRAVLLDKDGSLSAADAAAAAADVNFAAGRFPAYRIGPDSAAIDDDDDDVPSLRDIVAVEAAQLIEQQKRLSVRVLADRFEKGLAAAAAAKLDEGKADAGSLDRHVVMKKLRDVLESLRGRVAGRNKDDAEEAISMVEALAVQMTRREGEVLHEKVELRRLGAILKQTSEDAKKAVEEERSLARAEVENARAAIQRVQEAIKEQEQTYGSTGKQTKEFEELMKEVQEARRIKMLHLPSKVMDMENELRGLQIQLAQKSLYCNQLMKQAAMSKRFEENNSYLYILEGSESLGSCLRICPQTDTALDISSCPIQWFRKRCEEGSNKELISGATRPVYAPEPFDVGKILEAEISVNDERITVRTAGPIDPAPGLGTYVDTLLRKPDIEFNVVVVQMNGRDQSSNSLHIFHVGKMRIKLCKGKSTKAKEKYSSSMQLCGVRGGGDAAAHTLFWQVKKRLSYTLAFESPRERNTAIMLARRFAAHYNLTLAGPGDHVRIGNE